MSQTLSPVVIQNNGASIAPNTFSVLASMTPSVSPPSIQPNVPVPLATTPLATARRTGFVSGNTAIVNTSTPVVVPQTVNSVVPIVTTNVPSARASPTIPITQMNNLSRINSPSSVGTAGVPIQVGLPQPQLGQSQLNQGQLSPAQLSQLSQSQLSQLSQAQLSQLSQGRLSPAQASQLSQLSQGQVSQVAITQPRLNATNQVAISQPQIGFSQQSVPGQIGFSQQSVPGQIGFSQQSVPGQIGFSQQSVPGQIGFSQQSVPGQIGFSQQSIPGQIGFSQQSVPGQSGFSQQSVPGQIGFSQQTVPGQIGFSQQTVPGQIGFSQQTVPGQIGVNQPRSPNVQVSTLSGTPVQIGVNQAPASPNARSALLNLSAGATQQSVTIPTMKTPVGNRVEQESLLFPTIKVASPTSSLPLKPTAEIMNQEFEVRDYQGLISNSSLENELLNAGYAPLSKIVIRTDNGDKRTQYIKAINKKGQKVFILVDVNGYTTARSTDLTLIEAHSASVVPYSLKTGAYECAGKDVCGVAFECGSDAVCVLSRGTQDLSPKEANFVFVEQSAPSAATLESEGTIMTYPVIRLSEIRANPALVLANTDIVTRRLRNSAYIAELQELAVAQQAIGRLNEAFVRFNKLREDAGNKLNRTLTQLEQWNDVYMANPPVTDEAKDRYRKLQYNLAQRNDGIATLLRSIKKVADKRIEIDAITKEINDITDYAEKEFANVEFANSE